MNQAEKQEGAERWRGITIREAAGGIANEASSGEQTDRHINREEPDSYLQQEPELTAAAA